MDELITLELKQSNSNNVIKNGDYTTILGNQVNMNDGDMISVSKVFIDSSDETQVSITVPEDLNFTFNAVLYNVNWTSDQKTYINEVPSAGPLDCKKYVLCSRVESPNLEVYYIIKSVTFNYNNEGSGLFRFARSWGNIICRFQYTDLTGATQTHSVDVPNTSTNITTLTIAVDLLSKDGLFTLISPDLTTLANYPYFVQTPIVNTENDSGFVVNFTPIVYTTTFLVKQGEYDPVYFAKMITDKLTFNQRNPLDLANRFSPVKNPFLFSTNDWNDAAGIYYFVDSEEGLNAFNYAVALEELNGGVWVGSNQISLEFSNNRFYWSNLHMPIYNAAGSKVCQYVPFNLPAGSGALENQACPVLANGGLIWQSIFTDSTDPIYKDFFTNVLGFGLGTTASYKHELVPIGNGEAYVPIYNWNVDNFTQGLNSIDIGVVKNADFFLVQNCQTLQTIIDEEIQGIYANDIFSKSGFSFGYYQIEITTNFKNMLIGTDIKRNITALVSRYYENNSYCSGNISDAIPYIHRGVPIQLSSIGVRILDSNGLVVNGLGNDSSIYLEIKRNNQNEIKNKKKS
jgi:hypothetical protein